jgi:tight adherence protein B
LFEHREAGWSSVLGRQLRAVFSVLLSHNWGMKAGALTLMLTGSAGAGAAWLMIHLGLHLSDPITLVAMALGFFFAPRMLLKHQQSGADTKFMAVFPDSIDMIIRMLRAGLPVTVAVRSVGDEAPPPVAEVFTSLADQMAIGIAFEDALSAAGQRIGLADFRFFAVAVSLQRATGGNLATTLDILSDIMRKRRGMRLQAKATTGEVRMSAYVLGVIPFLIIGGLLIMTPDYLRPLISDRRGKIIIAVAVTSMLTGFVIIRQMMLSVTRAT